MNNKEIKNKSVALATIVLMLGNSSCVFADNNISKDETVYSKLNIENTILSRSLRDCGTFFTQILHTLCAFFIM